MRRRPRTSTSTDTLVPYTTRFRSDGTKGRGRRIEARQAFDIDAGLGCDTERGHAGPVGQLAGQNAYADKIASVNALEALCHDCLYTEEKCRLRCPVTGGSRAIGAAREDDSGNLRGAIGLGRTEDFNGGSCRADRHRSETR